LDVLRDDRLAQVEVGRGASKAEVARHRQEDGKTGIVHADNFWLSVRSALGYPIITITNAGAQPGDMLVLTKPLGTGIITTGIDRQLATPATIQAVTHQMASLNRDAAHAIQAIGVHACTDVSGFGLIGHLHQMAAASGVGLG
jgi:selenide,water dikinase